MLIGLGMEKIEFGADVVLGLTEAPVLAVDCEDVEVMRGKGSQDGRDMEVKKAAVVDVNVDRRDGGGGVEGVEYGLARVLCVKLWWSLLDQSWARSVGQGEGVRRKREDGADLVGVSC